eukprot:1161671-Pelagomonas_calceolata.AAC.24
MMCLHDPRGELSDVVVMIGRGFGFATFADPRNAATFLACKEHVIGKYSGAPHALRGDSVILHCKAQTLECRSWDTLAA